jgi:hypothetical protein
MSKWSGGELERVETAKTIKKHGQSDKTILELVRELDDG